MRIRFKAGQFSEQDKSYIEAFVRKFFSHKFPGEVSVRRDSKNRPIASTELDLESEIDDWWFNRHSNLPTSSESSKVPSGKHARRNSRNGNV